MPSTLPNARHLVVPDLPDPGRGKAEPLGVRLARPIDDLLLQLRAELPSLDPPREVHLLRRVQQRDLPDLLQVHPDRVVGGRLERVDLDADLRHGIGVVPGKLDDLDARGVQVVGQLRENVLDLIGRDLRQCLEDVARCDEAAFAAEHDELFLDLIEAVGVRNRFAGRAQRGSSSCVGSTA